MISILRGRTVRIAALLAAVMALAVGLGTPAAGASISQVCGNEGSGYCLNDWGGAGASGDAVKMYYGGTRNDDFYVQDVNRCNGGYRVTARSYGDASNCPFADVSLDSNYRGQPIVQITYTNNSVMCVGSTSSDFAVLGVCADPITGSGGAQGVIMIQVGGAPPAFFVDRYASDQHSAARFLTSGGNLGVQANYNGQTIWGGYQVFLP